MIAFLAGTIREQAKASIVLMVNGIGYRVAVLDSFLGRHKVGDEVEIRTYQHVTSDAVTLFGFSDEHELTYFELLLTVPSVGPRTALGILSAAPPKVLAQAVADNDSKILTKVSGVGKRTAERILVELKDKVDATPSDQPAGELQTEVVSVLVNLGYSTAQAQAAVQKLPSDTKSPEEAVRLLLQQQKT